jgi:hypothetical protein
MMASLEKLNEELGELGRKKCKTNPIVSRVLEQAAESA